MLAPYPNQPRKYIDLDRLAELEASVSRRGVRDSVVVTPVSMAPWSGLEEGDVRPFLIVSGHHRTAASVKAGLQAVPYVVRVYASKSEFERDAEVLNDHRENLSEIEEGWSYRNRIADGEKIMQIVDDSGKTYPYVRGRINLTYLCPTIQERISPKLRPRQRLAIGLASALGGINPSKVPDLAEKLEELGDDEFLPDNLSSEEQRFRLQRAYLSYCLKRKWKGVDSAQFVLTGKEPAGKDRLSNLKRRNAEEGADFRMPSHPRDKLNAAMRIFGQTGLLGMKPADLKFALQKIARQDLKGYAEFLVGFGEALSRVAENNPEHSGASSHRRVEQKILDEIYEL